MMNNGDMNNLRQLPKNNFGASFMAICCTHVCFHRIGVVDTCYGLNFAPWARVAFGKDSLINIFNGMISLSTPNHSYNIVLFLGLNQWRDIQEVCDERNVSIECAVWYKSGMNYVGDQKRLSKRGRT